MVGLITYAAMIVGYLLLKLLDRFGLIPSKLRRIGRALADRSKNLRILGRPVRFLRRRPLVGSLAVSAGAGVLVASIPYLLLMLFHVFFLLIVIFALLNGGIEEEPVEDENVFSGSSYGPSNDMGSYDEDWSAAMGKLPRP